MIDRAVERVVWVNDTHVELLTADVASEFGLFFGHVLMLPPAQLAPVSLRLGVGPHILQPRRVRGVMHQPRHHHRTILVVAPPARIREYLLASDPLKRGFLARVGCGAAGAGEGAAHGLHFARCAISVPTVSGSPQRGQLVGMGGRPGLRLGGGGLFNCKNHS